MKRIIGFLWLLVFSILTKSLSAQKNHSHFWLPDLRPQLYSDSLTEKFFESERCNKYPIDTLFDRIKQLDVNDYDRFLVKYNFCSYVNLGSPCDSSYVQRFKDDNYGHMPQYFGLSDTMLFRCFQMLYENNQIPEEFKTRFQREYATGILNSEAVVVGEVVGWKQPTFEADAKGKLPYGAPAKIHLIKILRVPYSVIDISVGDTILMGFGDGISKLFSDITDGDTVWKPDGFSWGPEIPTFHIGDTIVPFLHRRGKFIMLRRLLIDDKNPSEHYCLSVFQGQKFISENIKWNNSIKNRWPRDPDEIERFIQFLNEKCSEMNDNNPRNE